MRISELVSHWERDAKGRMSHTTYSIPLDVESAARLAALAEMYPKRSAEALLGELVGAALEAVPFLLFPPGGGGAPPRVPALPLS